MKTFRFKIRYDEEFQDYYFRPFKNREEYVWINDIFETNKGLLAITEYGDIPVKEIDWKNMLVICEVKQYEKVESRICPRCGKPMNGFPALSRKDNKTEICSQCGQDEAMEAFNNYYGLK